MASEIRVDKITSLSGVGTISPSPTGVEIAGITTVATLKATTGIVTTLTATTGIVTTLTANTTKITTGIVTTLTVTTGIVTSLSANEFGVGTDSPNTELEIQSATDPKIRLQSQETGNKRLDLYVDGGEAVGTIAADQSSSQLAFRTSGTERVRINQTGLVGIGTITPSAILHVEKDGTSQTLARFESNLGTNNNRSITLSSPASDSVASPFIVQTGNSIQFRIDSTDALRIEDDSRIGIGTDDPATILHVQANNGDMLRLDRQNNAGGTGNQIAFRHNNATGTAIETGSINCVITADAASGQLRFYTKENGGSNTEKLRILPAGGITFNGDSATANALDDYEEGTWTPTVTEGTVSASNAIYTKIGRLVNLNARLETFSNRSSSNNISVGGIPFAVQDATNIGTGVFYRVAHTDEGHIGTMVTGSDKVQFLVSSQGGSESWFYLQHADLNSSGSQVRFNVWYVTAE